MIEIKYNIPFGIGLSGYENIFFINLEICSDRQTLLKLRSYFFDHCYFEYSEIKSCSEKSLFLFIMQFPVPHSVLTFGYTKNLYWLKSEESSYTKLKESIVSSIKDLQENSTKQMMNIDNEIGYMNFFSRLFLKYGDDVKIYDL